MAVSTLLKAGLKRKKGSFIGVIVLMIIISMSIVSVLSIKENSRMSVVDSISKTNSPDLSVLIMEDQLSEEMLNKIKNDPNVGEVKEIETLMVRNIYVNGVETPGGLMLLTPYQSRLPQFKEDGSGYSDSRRSPANGGAYVTQQFLLEHSVSVGDQIGADIYYTNDQTPERLNISGAVADPKFGGMTRRI